MNEKYSNFEALQILAKALMKKGLKKRTKEIIKAICQLFEADYSHIVINSNGKIIPWLIYDRDKNQFEEIVDEKTNFQKGLFPKQLAGWRCIAGYVCETGEVEIIENINNYKFKDFCSKRFLEKAIINSEVILPIDGVEPIQWVLCLSSKHIGHFSRKFENIYKIVSIFCSSNLTEALEIKERKIEKSFEKILDHFIHLKIEEKYWNQVDECIRQVSDLLDINRASLYLLQNNQSSKFIKYYDSVDRSNLPKLVDPQSLGFYWNNEKRSWDYKKDKKIFIYMIKNRSSVHIGYLKFQISTTFHASLIRSLTRRLSLRIETFLKEERSLKAAKLRKRIINYEQNFSYDWPKEKFNALREQIIQECNLSKVQFWVVDEFKTDTARLFADPTNYVIYKTDECYISETWRSKEPCFKFNILKTDPKLKYPELCETDFFSWVGYPIVRGRKIIGIVAYISKKEDILNIQHLPVFETAALILSLELELTEINSKLIKNRFIESHQISAHLQNVLSKLDLIHRLNKKNKLTPQKLNTDIENTKAFLRLAIRNLNLEGKSIEELSDFSANYQSVYKCLAQTVAMVRTVNSGEERKISMYYEKFRHFCTFDDISLQEAFLAVLLNASKYSVIGSEIRIVFNYSNNVAKVFIMNIGIGVIEGDEEKIFHRGVQGANVTPDLAMDFEAVAAGHKGFGLNIAKRMQRTGGDILLSNPGKCFDIKKKFISHQEQDGIPEEDYTIFEIILPNG